jgi:hypothetical protein
MDHSFFNDFSLSSHCSFTQLLPTDAMKNNIPILPNSNLQPLLRKVVPTPIVEIWRR